MPRARVAPWGVQVPARRSIFDDISVARPPGIRCRAPCPVCSRSKTPQPTAGRDPAIATLFPLRRFVTSDTRRILFATGDYRAALRSPWPVVTAAQSGAGLCIARCHPSLVSERDTGAVPVIRIGERPGRAGHDGLRGHGLGRPIHARAPQVGNLRSLAVTVLRSRPPGPRDIAPGGLKNGPRCTKTTTDGVVVRPGPACAIPGGCRASDVYRADAARDEARSTRRDPWHAGVQVAARRRRRCERSVLSSHQCQDGPVEVGGGDRDGPVTAPATATQGLEGDPRCMDGRQSRTWSRNAATEWAHSPRPRRRQR